jgi:hypothetical protein
MIRGTTPDYILTLDGVDLSDKTVYVTIKQCRKLLTKTGDELTIAVGETGSTIAFALTQEDTLGLSAGSASIQVRFIDSEGVARATETAALNVEKVLLERVIEYDADNPA